MELSISPIEFTISPAERIVSPIAPFTCGN